MRRKPAFGLALHGAPRGWRETITRVVTRSLAYRRGNAPAAAIRMAAVDVSIAFVSDSEMARVNEQWLAHEGPTDVITFDLRDDPTSHDIRGELVISLDTAQREARERGHAWRDEAMLYIAHGMLHLMGYDDATSPAARRMHQLEDEILSTCGLTAVFRNRAKPTRGRSGRH